MKPYKRIYPKGSDEANRIIKYTAEKGHHPGQEFAGVKDYMAWRRLLEYLTGNPGFGSNPTNPKDPRTDSELLRAKTNCAFSKLLDALDTIAEGEAGKLKAERKLNALLWKHLEAKRKIELKFYGVRE